MSIQRLILPVFAFATACCASLLAFAADESAAPQAPPADASAGGALSGRAIAEHVDARDLGDVIRQTVVMKLTDASGSVRERRAVFIERKFGDATKMMIYFQEPSNLKGTGFLTYAYKKADKADDQWLYLPAVGRARRISSSDRGGYFLGTDLTYEDMKQQTRPPLDEYQFQAAGQEVINGVKCLLVDATPTSAQTAKEVGYGKVRIAVDPSNWMAVRADYWDVALNPLKTVSLLDIKDVQGHLTPGRLVAVNHKTGSQTEFNFDDIDYAANLTEDQFTEQSLRDGLN